MEKQNIKNQSLANTERLKRDYAELKFKASVMYIKDGLSADAVSKKLDVSMVTVSKWKKLGRWSELRPDMEILNQYRAANMYIVQQMATNAISQILNVPEFMINTWVELNGWKASRLINSSIEVTSTIVQSFCVYFKKKFPEHSTIIELIQGMYLKDLSKKL